MGSKGFVVVGIVACGLFYWWQSNAAVGETPRHDQVIMYCVSGNPVCQVRSEELRAEGIEFTEVWVDQDRTKLQEVQVKLVQADFDRMTGRYEFPIYDVHGMILVDNPELSKVKKYLTR